MPLIRKIDIDKNTFVAVWEMNEALATLRAAVSIPIDQYEAYNRISNEQRKKEWLTSRLLVQQFAGPGARIIYDHKGAPLLQNAAGSISITHSDRFCCVMFCNTACGVDTESISRNIRAVAPRFLSSAEQDFIYSDTDLCAAWCAKEAFYKYIGKTEIAFADDFTIEKIEPEHVFLRFENKRYCGSLFGFEGHLLVCFH